MIGDVFAEVGGALGIRDLLELEQVIVQRGDGLERAEADIEIAVQTLRRGRCGDHQRSAGRCGRLRCECARQGSAADQGRAALDHVAAADRMTTSVFSRHSALSYASTCQPA
jgi:hypothetical protein